MCLSGGRWTTSAAGDTSSERGVKSDLIFLFHIYMLHNVQFLHFFPVMPLSC